MDRADTTFFLYFKVCTHVSKEDMHFTGIKGGLCPLSSPEVLFPLPKFCNVLLT